METEGWLVNMDGKQVERAVANMADAVAGFMWQSADERMWAQAERMALVELAEDIATDVRRGETILCHCQPVNQGY